MVVRRVVLYFFFRILIPVCICMMVRRMVLIMYNKSHSNKIIKIQPRTNVKLCDSYYIKNKIH